MISFDEVEVKELYYKQDARCWHCNYKTIEGRRHYYCYIMEKRHQIKSGSQFDCTVRDMEACLIRQRIIPARAGRR